MKFEELLHRFSFLTGKTNFLGERVKLKDDFRRLNTKILHVDSGIPEYPEIVWFSINGNCIAHVFSPGEDVKIRAATIKADTYLKAFVSGKENFFFVQESKEGDTVLEYLAPVVCTGEDFLEFFITGGFYHVNFVEALKLPAYHFAHPFSFEYTKPLLWFGFRKQEIYRYKLFLPTFWPLWERYKQIYMCRGIFFPTWKLRSLTFRGTGEIGFVRLANFTAEKAKFVWLLPDRYKKLAGFLVNNKLVHELEVEPGKEVRIKAWISPKITQLEQDFVSSVVIAYSRSRVEWLPLPLLTEREEGDFFLEPEDGAPEV